MVTVNKRVKKPKGIIVNGVDNAGVMRLGVSSGYDRVLRTWADGRSVPLRDREGQYVRGFLLTQDWPHIIDLLTGTVGTYIFFERKAGVAPATGFIKHTITNPAIHRVNLRLASGPNVSYAAIRADFECKADDETKTLADMWALTDSQADPGLPAEDVAAGGLRIISNVHGASSIYHTTLLDLTINMPLSKAYNDGDVGYTCVDVEEDGMSVIGSLGFRDATIAANKLLGQTLLLAARNNLVLNVRQAQGATTQVLTIAGVEFDNLEQTDAIDQEFADFNLNFEVSDSLATPLTLTGTNKIITVADAA